MIQRGGDDGIDKKNSIALNAGVGGLTFAGGLIGFLAKGSKPSLIAGSTMGGTLILSSFLISKKLLVGNILGSLFASMLSYTMGKKFMASKKIFPPGVLTLLGSLAVLVNLFEAVRAIGRANSDGDENKSDEKDS